MNKKDRVIFTVCIFAIILLATWFMYSTQYTEKTMGSDQDESLVSDDGRLIGLYHIDSIQQLFQAVDYPNDHVFKFGPNRSYLLLGCEKNVEAKDFLKPIIDDSSVDSLNNLFDNDKFYIDKGSLTIKFYRQFPNDTFIYVPHFMVAMALNKKNY